MNPSTVSLITGAFALAFTSFLHAETVGVFFNPDEPQIKFAAGDVKSALEQKKITVEMLPLSALKETYAHKKVVIALASSPAVTKILTA